VPPAVLEEGNVTLHLVAVDQQLDQPADVPENIQPQDFLASPAGSDETRISREGPVIESTHLPAEETQAMVAMESPQEAAVRRAPARTVARRRTSTLDIPDRRAMRGELIVRDMIQDSRREGRLNRTLQSHQHGSLIRSLGRDAGALDSLARSYLRDILATARHWQRLYRYMDKLVNVCQDSVQVQRNAVQEQRNRTAILEGLRTEVHSVAGPSSSLLATCHYLILLNSSLQYQRRNR
ncbi:hypothetical protein JD844_008030, partial [Phrynosoma platyrhinos]